MDDEVQDSAIVEEAILYEARTDESKREFVTALQHVFEDASDAIQAVRSEALQGIEAGIRAHGAAAVAAADGKHTAMTVLLLLRPETLAEAVWWVAEAGVAAAWARLAACIGDTVTKAIDKAQHVYDAALEAHATRTHERLRALKEAQARRLALHRRAAEASAEARDNKAETAIKEARLQGRTQDAKKVIDNQARLHAEKQDELVALTKKLERRLLLTRADLDKEQQLSANLAADLEALRSEPRHDQVSNELDRCDRLLALTGLERTEALNNKLLCLVKKQIAVCLAPDRYRLLKSEILQLRSQKVALEKAVESSNAHATEALVASVDAKRDKADFEKQLNDLKRKHANLKTAHRAVSKQVADLKDAMKRQADARPKQLRPKRSAGRGRRPEDGRAYSTDSSASSIMPDAPSPATTPSKKKKGPQWPIEDFDDRPSTASSDAQMVAITEPPPIVAEPHATPQLVVISEPEPVVTKVPPEQPGAPKEVVINEPVVTKVPSEQSVAPKEVVIHEPVIARVPSEQQLPPPAVVVHNEAVAPISADDKAVSTASPCPAAATMLQGPTTFERGTLTDPAVEEAPVVIVDSAETMHLRAEVERERQAAQVARARFGETHARARRMQQRLAQLELAVSEKNVLLAEMTRLAREQRAAARDFEDRLKRSNNLARSQSTPIFYQRGPTRITTPVAEPVTGRLRQVKAPIRQAPLHQSHPAMNKTELRSLITRRALPATT